MFARNSTQLVRQALRRFSSSAYNLQLDHAVRLNPDNLKVIKISSSTRPIFLYPNFLTDMEVKQIKQITSDVPLEHARVNVAKHVGAKVEKKIVPALQSHFTAEIAMDDKTQAIFNHRFFSLNAIRTKTSVVQGNFRGDFDIIGFSQILKFLSYIPPAERNNFGIEKMVMHRDYPELQSNIPYVVSMYSFLACLNQAKRGGGLDLYSEDSPRVKLNINLNAGDIMFFPANPVSMLHNPVPVTEGHRLIMRGLVLGAKL